MSEQTAKLYNLTQEASVIIVTYNSAEYILGAIRSVLDNDPLEVIVVDNNSNDETVTLVKKLFPKIKVIENKVNVGFGKACNIGAKVASGRYLVFLNPDTVVEEGWLSNLLKPLMRSDKIITVSNVLSMNDRTSIACGLILHYSGLAFMRALEDDGEALAGRKDVKINGIYGCSFAIKKEDFFLLGGFDEDFFLYHEDVELSWRALAKNFEILCVPSSVVLHRYEWHYHPRRIYLLEKGRYLLVRKYYRWKHLLIFLPSIIVTELITLIFFLRWGIKGLAYKYKGFYDAIKMRVRNLDSRYDIEKILDNLSWSIPVRRSGSRKRDMVVAVIRKSISLAYLLNYLFAKWILKI